MGQRGPRRQVGHKRRQLGLATTPWGEGGGHGNGQKVSWSPAGPPLRAVGPQGRGALGPDLLSLFLSRGCPLGPGEPSHVPDGGARAHPHPAEPGGHCVGQLRAPDHRHGCHQPADSGTGLSSWLVGPSAGHPLLTLLTLYLVLLPRVSQGSVEFVRKQKGPTIPTGPCPLPPHASPGLPRGEGARLHRAVSCTLAVSAAAGGGELGPPSSHGASDTAVLRTWPVGTQRSWRQGPLSSVEVEAAGFCLGP